jgi:hypothetical protein
LPATRFVCFAVGGLVLLLQACAENPAARVAPSASERPPVPEINLNLPDHGGAACACEPEEEVDATFLDKGLAALVAGDHREAVNYFRRYQRLESSPGVDWEASIAVAYVKMMPDSPYYNPNAATESYRRLMRVRPTDIPLHEKVLIMRDSLEIFVHLHTQIDDLQNENGLLQENLEKREDALRRLRELTLGQ